MRIRGVLILLISLIFSLQAVAQEYNKVVDGRDTIYYNYVPIQQQETQRKVRTTFSVAPIYTPATSFAIGAAVQSRYSTAKSSNALFSAAAVVSIRGMYSVGVTNINPFSGGKHQLAVSVSVSAMPTKFWGVGYDAATQNNALNYTRRHYSAEVEYLGRVAKNLYLGPCLELAYNDCKDDFGTISHLLSDKAEGKIIATTISLIAKYDTRDSRSNPQKGLYLTLRPFIRPSFISNTTDSSFGVEGALSGYQRLWKGAILAGELYALLGSQNTPWQFYAEVGDSHRMRGYYEGQFRDVNLVTAQVELRQSIWRGIGVAAWAGAGNSFGTFKKFCWSQTLPNYGLGVRWVASDSLVFRFDYGFGARVGGRLINGALFSVGSAF